MLENIQQIFVENQEKLDDRINQCFNHKKLSIEPASHSLKEHQIIDILEKNQRNNQNLISNYQKL